MTKTGPDLARGRWETLSWPRSVRASRGRAPSPSRARSRPEAPRRAAAKAGQSGEAPRPPVEPEAPPAKAVQGPVNCRAPGRIRHAGTARRKPARERKADRPAAGGAAHVERNPDRARSGRASRVGRSAASGARAGERRRRRRRGVHGRRQTPEAAPSNQLPTSKRSLATSRSAIEHGGQGDGRLPAAARDAARSRRRSATISAKWSVRSAMSPNITCPILRGVSRRRRR